MGDSVQQWRAIIGLWSGGRQRKCVTSQHHIAQTSDHIGYKYIRFVVLVSLLVIGCVELNPGPDHENSGPTQSAGAHPKFSRRRGTSGQHGEQYEVKMAAFLFARALNRTEEFRLASNVDGAGAFDDLVFRYRLRESDVWKTCFIQLKHKEKGGKIQRSSLTQMSGKFSLLKYFESFCEIKNNADKNCNLKQCGTFGDFEFVIYTNGEMESKSPLQGGDTDPISILSSGTDCGKYIAFDENSDTNTSVKPTDKDIFNFFEELLAYHELIKELNSYLKSRASVDKHINEKIKGLQNLVTNNTILKTLYSLETMINIDIKTAWIDEMAKCDFTFHKEYLTKVKIFHNQSNEKSLKGLIEKELEQVCKASPSVANYIYPKFELCFSDWNKEKEEVAWLNKSSDLWKNIQEDMISEISKISESEMQEIAGCGTLFNKTHVQKLTRAIEQSTVLIVFADSSNRILQKKKTYEALNHLGYKESLFINISYLIRTQNYIINFWPCEWSKIMVVDCGSDCTSNHLRKILQILQKRGDNGKILGNSDENRAEKFIDILKKYQQKVILISPRMKDTEFQKELLNISNRFKVNCKFTD